MASKKDPQQASNADEYLLQQTLHFAESLKDLKSIRAQMYSAAEHFELSYYKNNDQQQLVEDTLKDYICKAVISTVDHLGSVACKVASFLDEKVDEISSASLLFSGIEQRLRAHQQFIDLSGLSRQLLVPDTAKHYKRYSVTGLKGHDKMKLQSIRSDCVLYPQVDSQMQRHNQDDHIAKAFQVAGSKSKAPLLRKGHSGPRSDEVSRKPKSFSFMRAASIKEIGKRAVSPLKFPVQRSGPFDNRSTSPSAIDIKQRCPSEPRRHKRELTNLERSKGKDIEVYSRKSKHLFRALLSIHVSRKQGVPNRFSGGK